MHPKLLLSPVSYPWELLEMEMMVPVPSTESKTLGIGLRNLVYKAVCVIWCTLKSGSHGLHQSIHHSMKKSTWPMKVNTHINWWQLIVMNHSHNNASFFPQYYIYTFWVWGWLWVVCIYSVYMWKEAKWTKVLFLLPPNLLGHLCAIKISCFKGWLELLTSTCKLEHSNSSTSIRYLPN